MVAQLPIANLHNFTVHLVRLSLSTFSPPAKSGGIKRISALNSVPPVFCQSLIIIRVDDGVFAPRQTYPAERIAEANPPIQKYK